MKYSRSLYRQYAQLHHMTYTITILQSLHAQALTKNNVSVVN